MTRVKLELLQEELAGLQLVAGHLQYSMERCRNLVGQEALPPEQLERLESLTPHSQGHKTRTLAIGLVTLMIGGLSLSRALLNDAKARGKTLQPQFDTFRRKVAADFALDVELEGLHDSGPHKIEFSCWR